MAMGRFGTTCMQRTNTFFVQYYSALSVCTVVLYPICDYDIRRSGEYHGSRNKIRVLCLQPTLFCVRYNFVANSTDVAFDAIDISGYSQSKNVAKNTDGWDLYRTSNAVIQNSVINNGDDCVSFKPNATEMLVQNLHCNGSHGISVGSLGQYVGEVDIVENVYV